MSFYYAEGDTPAADAVAKNVLETLHQHYPAHPWAVYVRQGTLFIKHLAYPKSWGMAKQLGAVDFDATVLANGVKMMAGEFLERAALRRGEYHGEQIATLEGAS